MEGLQNEIEIVRKRLDNAVANGYNREACYSLSLELDRLIEVYIMKAEKMTRWTSKNERKQL